MQVVFNTDTTKSVAWQSGLFIEFIKKSIETSYLVAWENHHGFLQFAFVISQVEYSLGDLLQSLIHYDYVYIFYIDGNSR